MYSSVIVQRSLLIVYMDGVGGAEYIFVWIAFLGGESDKWEIEGGGKCVGCLWLVRD